MDTPETQDEPSTNSQEFQIVDEESNRTRRNSDVTETYYSINETQESDAHSERDDESTRENTEVDGKAVDDTEQSPYSDVEKDAENDGREISTRTWLVTISGNRSEENQNVDETKVYKTEDLPNLISPSAFIKVNKIFKGEENPSDVMVRKLTTTKRQRQETRARKSVANRLWDIKRSKLQTVNELYLEMVARGTCNEVKALFDLCKDDEKFYKNYIDGGGKSALRIALQNTDVAMLKLLLRKRVAPENILLHAIKQGFYEGVKAILEAESLSEIRQQSIKAEKRRGSRYRYHFEYGTDPIILASCRGSGKILKLLYDFGLRLPESNCDYLSSWEETTKERLLCSAKCSPAYISLICEEFPSESPIFAMEYCLTQIESMREHAKTEPESAEFYKELEDKLEDFMCHLLDELQSSREVAFLFEFEPDDSWYKHGFKGTPVGKESRKPPALGLICQACDMKLVKFISHRYCQTAITHLSYRDTKFLIDMSATKTAAFNIFIGLLYPILSLINTVAPTTTPGRFLFRPNVLYGSHMMSSFTFFAIVFANVAMKSAEHEYLGAPPVPTEWLILLWVLGKWVQEINEVYQKKLKSYLEDWWNYNDFIQLLLFAIWILLRIVDFSLHANDSVRVYRDGWTSRDPRTWSVAVVSWAYVFAFLRTLGLTKTIKVFGTLTASLSEMMVNVVHFIFIFGLILLAFALGITEVYWYYNTPRGMAFLCELAGNNGTACECSPTSFGAIGRSILDLFWVLFGQINVNALSFYGRHQLIEVIAVSLVAVYHVVGIIILINMLIAMMAKSFDAVTENKDAEWKFDRTKLWAGYIRQDVTRPPPMNLIPVPYNIKTYCRKLLGYTKDSGIEKVRKEKYNEIQRRLSQRYICKLLVDA